MARKRANQPAASRPRAPRPAKDRLLAWRGTVLVAVGGAGLAAVAVAYYARRGDLLTAGLFALSLLLLLLTTLVALGRTRRLRAEAERERADR